MESSPIFHQTFFAVFFFIFFFSRLQLKPINFVILSQHKNIVRKFTAKQKLQSVRVNGVSGMKEMKTGTRGKMGNSEMRVNGKRKKN